LTWGLIYQDISFNLSSLYYLFNFMPVIILLNLYYYFGDNILKYIYKAIFASVLIQVIISPFLINVGMTRQTLMFNNPNQLGYYSLLTLCILTLLFYLLGYNLSQYFIIIASTSYLSLLSNSSSAIFAVFLVILVQLFLIFIYRLNLKSKVYLLLFVILLSFFGVVFQKQISNVVLIDNAVTRIQGKENKASDTFEERHYDRLFEHPELIIFGAGEGLLSQRFGSTEIHSTLMSFLFNYGVITMMFLIILFLLFLNKPSFISVVIIISIHFYGLTNNGIRQPYFWMLNTIILIGNSNGAFDFSTIKYIFRHQKYLTYKG